MGWLKFLAVFLKQKRAKKETLISHWHNVMLVQRHLYCGVPFSTATALLLSMYWMLLTEKLMLHPCGRKWYWSSRPLIVQKSVYSSLKSLAKTMILKGLALTINIYFLNSGMIFLFHFVLGLFSLYLDSTETMVKGEMGRVKPWPRPDSNLGPHWQASSCMGGLACTATAPRVWKNSMITLT